MGNTDPTTVTTSGRSSTASLKKNDHEELSNQGSSSTTNPNPKAGESKLTKLMAKFRSPAVKASTDIRKKKRQNGWKRPTEADAPLSSNGWVFAA